jgi:hypothetical protein
MSTSDTPGELSCSRDNHYLSDRPGCAPYEAVTSFSTDHYAENASLVRDIYIQTSVPPQVSKNANSG